MMNQDQNTSRKHTLISPSASARSYPSVQVPETPIRSNNEQLYHSLNCLKMQSHRHGQPKPTAFLEAVVFLSVPRRINMSVVKQAKGQSQLQEVSGLVYLMLLCGSPDSSNPKLSIDLASSPPPSSSSLSSYTLQLSRHFSVSSPETILSAPIPSLMGINMNTDNSVTLVVDSKGRQAVSIKIKL